MPFFKAYRIDLILVSILSFATFILWWPPRMLPYWWDSAGYIMHAARFFLDINFTSFILPSDSTISAFAHFPLFPFLLALVWKIFGESLLVTHIFYFRPIWNVKSAVFLLFSEEKLRYWTVFM